MVCCLFFFFRQKTAYEMRMSDWSSDVCSSDLYRDEGLVRLMEVIHQRSGPSGVAENVYLLTGPGYQPLAGNLANWPAAASAQEGWLEVTLARRAAERRVGQEGVSTCRSGWSPSYYTKQTLQN